MKPRILIIYTGGTIGMIEDARTKAPEAFRLFTSYGKCA